MSRRANELAARREALLERSARLRAEIGADARIATASLGLLERCVAIARSGLVRPGLVLAAAGLIVIRPRAAWWLASRGLVLWPILKRILPRLLRLARAATATGNGECVPEAPRAP